jgi:hypothetical protein
VLLDKKVLSEINMGGKGGGEKAFAPALVDFRRVSRGLYDFVNDDTDEKVELKKQQNLQWFDGWKYHDLSKEDRAITMLFVLHDGEKVSQIYSIPLGIMIDTLLADDEYSIAGWHADVLETLFVLKQTASKVQSKLPLKVKDFVSKYAHLVNLEYQTANI